MNLKSLATLIGVFFILLLFIAGCQQESVAPQHSSDSKINSRSTLTCGEACGAITTADLIRSTGPNAGNDVGDVTVQNNATSVCIMISTIAGVTINDAQIYVGDCSLLPIVAGNGNYGHGSFNYQYPGPGFVLSADATCMTLTIPLPAGACYCVAMRVDLSGGPAWAQGSPTSNPLCSSNGCANGRVFTHCTQECDEEEVCYGPAESAWSTGPEYVQGGQWATYTAVGSFPATLFAGQTMNAGTVSYAGGNITITLAAGWEFRNVSENVKIQGYAAAPTQEPVPGQFTNKTTAAIGSSPYVVAVAAANFYGVHVDLVPIVECPE